MFGIGILLMLTLALCETFNMKKIAEDQGVKNFMTFVLSFSGFIISLLVFLAMPLFVEESTTKNAVNDNMSLFTDWRFYVAILSEIIGIWVARKNYEVNGNNITAINFSLFFSLVLVPLYAFLGNDFFGFEETLNINYESKTEFWIFISVMTFLTVLFFIDKVKGHINNIFLMLFLPIILSNSMFVTGKLMQTYEIGRASCRERVCMFV